MRDKHSLLEFCVTQLPLFASTQLIVGLLLVWALQSLT